ncbi:hypothetical protein CHCC20441_0231 [Bacillus licheniformis]|nr:hypothetical protein B4089_0919 [Bacillus licheniformis]TWJ44359.1 hypothetical protein CHCC5026_1370 [Bacillus licheniformis]TWK10447.1 hypothetical protein CHCC20440_2673 [Bacillus licheniformis]TWK12549.1 hypothetical protein CHCC20441_0231 [Bacillus licheniformis]TWK56600.1 hypothetical protein CHCC20343_2252 [Bacillus licheniformis]
MDFLFFYNFVTTYSAGNSYTRETALLREDKNDDFLKQKTVLTSSIISEP